VPESVLTAVQARLGGHPLALTWAGSQLGDATQPPAHFLRDLVAEPFTKLTEPGGDSGHTLRWMFDRSVRLLADSTRTVLTAVARLSEPFEESWAVVAGGAERDLQRLVQLSFLRLSSEPPGWQFAHALAAQYARTLPLPEELLESLGHHALAGITAADARCHAEGTAPLGLALAHATALLGHDATSRTLGIVANALIYDIRGVHPVGIRRGRLDFARSAVGAVRAWQEQASAEEKATSDWQRESASVFSKLGDLAVAQGDLAGALDSHTESKTIAERLAASDPANTKWQRDLSVSLNKLGELAVAQGDLAGALRSFTESKSIRERLAASDLANAAWQRDLAQSHCWVGMVEQQSGDLAKAKVSFTQYKNTMERLAASDPANAAWQRDLSVSFDKLGDLAVAQVDLAGALRSFTESKTIAERLAASDPANAAWQRDLSVSLNNLGDLAVAQGDLAGALRSFTEAKTIAESLAASDPVNAGWQRDLSVSFDKLGGLAVAQGDLAGALRSFTESKTIRERLTASDPANAAWHRDLSVSCWIIAAKVFQPQQRWAEALELMEQSLRIDERLAAPIRRM
jgi:tetratricopeptide (TPR) repeat protein